MHAFQNPGLLANLPGFEASPFLSDAPLTWTYLAWSALWVVLVLGLAALTFQRRDV
jgi:hypothetical protein